MRVVSAAGGFEDSVYEGGGGSDASKKEGGDAALGHVASLLQVTPENNGSVWNQHWVVSTMK